MSLFLGINFYDFLIVFTILTEIIPIFSKYTYTYLTVQHVEIIQLL